jgi:NTP pyrophosphatase (non-canonical NTP hydrolase)
MDGTQNYKQEIGDFLAQILNILRENGDPYS